MSLLYEMGQKIGGAPNINAAINEALEYYHKIEIKRPLEPEPNRPKTTEQIQDEAAKALEAYLNSNRAPLGNATPDNVFDPTEPNKDENER